MNNQLDPNKKEKVLTGDRATGQLHLGHYVGSLQQRISLQDQYEQTILVADLQGLTDNGHNPKKVSSNCSRRVQRYLNSPCIILIWYPWRDCSEIQRLKTR